MNDEIIKKMYDYAKENRRERKSLEVEFNACNDSEEKELIRERVVYLDTIYVEVRNSLNNLYNVIKENKSEEEIEEAKTRINDLAMRLDLIPKKESNKKKNKQIFKNIIIGAGLVGATAGICTGLKSCSNAETEEVEETQNEEEKETEKEEKTKYEMSSRLVDASDEKQVLARANEIFDKFINIPSVPEAAKEELSVEKIANLIRMCNGEFALNDGEIEYNSTIFDELGNTINAYHNATSFNQYGTNLEFKPTSVFFEEDTLAYKVASASDELVSKIYEDINANDVEKFKEDSIKWGEFLRDTVIYNDSTGKTISLWTVDNEQKYPLLKTLTSVYAPSILEYSLGIDLAVRDSKTNTFGDTFGICIPFCYNEHNELTTIPLSKMIYDINETPMNSLAERAGMYEEWKENNESIMVQCGLTTQAWFNDKYDREVGYSKKLK